MTSPPHKRSNNQDLESTMAGESTGNDMGSTFVPEKTAALPGTASQSQSVDQNLDRTMAEPAAAQKTTVGTEKSGGEKKATQLGDFKLIKKLGQGGMGEVYLAHQVSLDRHVALKVMNKQFSKQENFVKRFKREAQTMAKLNHPNIVQGYAVGEEQGLLFLAMELVKGHERGRSLQDWMDNLKKLEIGDALHVILVIADALKYANESSLVHRDIKPDNMLVTEKGVVKLSDMGLAKAQDEDMSMTQSGTGLGTPFYMPPEQAADAKRVDHRSDIYALGCTLYYFLTGSLPFTGNSAMELILAKTKGTFTRARSLNKDIPERLDLIIDKMIAKEPKSRYQTYEELIRDLQSIGRANPVLSFIGMTGGPVATPSATVLGGTMVGGSLGGSVVGGMNSTLVTTNASKATTPGSAAGSAKPGSSPTGQTQDDITWTVYQTMPNGPPKKARFTTTQIRQLLKSGALDSKNKAAPGNSTEVRPLASYPEFEQIVRAKVVQAHAEKKTERMAKMYEEIDREQKWRPWVKRFKGFFEGVKGLISLIIYLAVLAGICLGLWIYWPTIYSMIQSRIGGPPANTPPAATAPVTPTAPPTP